MATVGFKGTLKEFFANVQDEPELYFNDRGRDDRGLPRASSASSMPRCPTLLVAPKADYEIREVEAVSRRFRGRGLLSGASADGTRPGIFYVNTST